MALESYQINEVIQEFIKKEVTIKKDNPSHRIFLNEDYLIKKLNATSDEDIKNIRICASSFIDSFNSVSQPGFQIESDVDEYEMARARAFRKQELDPMFGKNRKSGCLSIISVIVVALCIMLIFT